MNIDGVVTSSSMTLLQLGVAGVFLLFLIGCLWIVWKGKVKAEGALIAEKDARLKDVKDFTDSITPLLRELKDTSVKQTELSQKTYESILSNNRGA